MTGNRSPGSAREQKELSRLMDVYQAYRRAEKSAEEARTLLDGRLDPDFREMVQEEYETSRGDMERLAEELKVLLLPADPNDSEKTSLWKSAAERAARKRPSLRRLFTVCIPCTPSAAAGRWKSSTSTRLSWEASRKSALCSWEDGAYSRLKFESGVHRVQRVAGHRVLRPGAYLDRDRGRSPREAGGKWNWRSTPPEIQTDTFRSSGAGGQHVNKTESAIRLTHIPSGIVVECQDERSQYKNKDRAMKILRSKLLEMKQQEQTSAIAAERRSQVGTGDRSERIRTYNFPQGRVTDHRIGLTLYKIEAIMNGDLDEIVDGLVTADQAERLRANGEE